MSKSQTHLQNLFHTIQRISACTICATMLLNPIFPAFAASDWPPGEHISSSTPEDSPSPSESSIETAPSIPNSENSETPETPLPALPQDEAQETAPSASPQDETQDLENPNIPQTELDPTSPILPSPNGAENADTENVIPPMKLEPAISPVTEADPVPTLQIPVKKATPMTNLALGVTAITSSDEQTTTQKGLLTDGDKYYLKHNDTANKVASGNNGQNWEEYKEQGATINAKSGWIQVDLGNSYPIEVINLKRQVYKNAPKNQDFQNGGATHTRINGEAITYEKTAIVIGNEPNLSDGKIIYYQEGAELPQGVKVPASASPTYTEAMGGQWFYMDPSNEGGLGATELGDTKNARYVRVYTENPEENQLKFMELGIYGYQNAGDIQTAHQRRIINNENPLMIGTAYSSDTYAIGQSDEPELQGYNTVSGRCQAIPDDLQDSYTMLLHTNNLRQFSPEHISQANMQAYFEHGLQLCYENNTDALLLGISASATPGGAHWYVQRDFDYGWLDLMYRMYPNLEGTLNTENYWSGAADAVATNSAKQLEMARKYGGYFVWADQDHGGYVETAFTNPTWKDALMKYGDSCYMIYKNTSAANDDLKTSSYHQGSWLAGYTAGWGMLSDTWFWNNKNFAKLYENKDHKTSVWQSICGAPEALIGSQMISTYLGGGVIYTFEFPEIVYGSKNTNSPAFTHVLSKLFSHFKENPAPSRAQILDETKVFLHGNVKKDFYSVTAGTQTGINIYQTGRCGLIPVALPVESKEEFTNRMIAESKKLGLHSVPNIIETTSPLLSGDYAAKYFQTLYEKEYDGTAFADKLHDKKRGDVWYVYNNVLNTNTEQTATLPLAGEKGAHITATLEPHTYFYLNEKNNTLKLHLNNYRIDKDKWVFDNPQKWDWSGNFAPGQGVLAGKKSVYDYMCTYNVVNADTSKGENSPVDNDLRTTTFTLSKLTQEPVVRLVDGQQPDTDGAQQYDAPMATFDTQTGVATITITSNGWGDYEITNLHYAADDDFHLSEDPSLGGKEQNFALHHPVTYSSQPSEEQRASYMVDGQAKKPDDYSDPGGNAGGAQWAQIDFGQVQKTREVKMWRYWGDDREYRDTVILLSESEDFPADHTLVLWNSNSDANRIWPGDGNGQTGSHKLPAGTDPLYKEKDFAGENGGKVFPIYGAHVKWLDEDPNRALPQKGELFDARYVRIYMNGNTRGNTNHIVELMVNGIANDIILNDTQAPTTPQNLKVINHSSTMAALSFDPAVDDIGLKGYEVRYQKQGDSTYSTLFTTSTTPSISGLQPLTTYKFSVVAVDNAGNLSDVSNSILVTTASYEPDAGSNDTQAPTTPQNLKVINHSSTMAALSFDPAVDDIGLKGYEVRYQKQGDSTYSTLFTTSTTPSISGLQPLTTYKFSVVAVDNAGNLLDVSNSILLTEQIGDTCIA